MSRQKILQAIGYGAFAVVSLLFGLYLTFPADAAAQRLAQEVQKQSRGAWQLSYGSASAYRLSGIALEQVTLKQTGTTPDLVVLQFDAMRARLRLLPLLVATLSIDARLQLGEGELSARVTPQRDGSGMALQLDADDVDLSAPPLIARLTGLGAGGKVNGSLQTLWDADVRKSNGDLELTIQTASVGPGAVAGFTLPNVGLGDITLSAELRDGKLRLTHFTQKGGNVGIQAKGSAGLRPLLASSALDACVQFRADQTFLNSNPKLKTALQLAEVQLRRDTEGYLHVPLQGTFNAPRLAGGLCK